MNGFQLLRILFQLTSTRSKCFHQSTRDEKLAKTLIDSNAAIKKNIVQLLIKNEADVNAKDNNRQETTLREMAHQGKLEIAKILLES